MHSVQLRIRSFRTQRRSRRGPSGTAHGCIAWLGSVSQRLDHQLGLRLAVSGHPKTRNSTAYLEPRLRWKKLTAYSSERRRRSSSLETWDVTKVTSTRRARS